MPRALVSVSDKTGVVDFARALAGRGYDLVSTGGTARALQAAAIPATSVSDITGFPEMLDGRVKTLHPAVHGGILARRHRPEDLRALTRHGIGLIDIVAVNLYPFLQTAANPDAPFDALIEEIDIGGPSLIRAAAKNFADVLVIVSPFDYQAVLAELDRRGGPSLEFRLELARKAFAHTAGYDAAIAATLATVEAETDGFTRRAPARTNGVEGPVLSDASSVNTSGVEGPALSNVEGLPEELILRLRKIRDLRYGENPHQTAAWYATEPRAGLSAARVMQGKELSFTNLLDLDAAARIVLEFEEPAAAVIKHANPCGAAIGQTPVEAYVRARDADSVAAFGGIVGLNRPIDDDTARTIVKTFIEGVIAPGLSDAARSIFATKPNMRVIVADLTNISAAPADRELRTILGAALVQDRDRVREAQLVWSAGSAGEAGLQVVTRRPPTDEEWAALRFAWRICAHVKSNAVIFTNATRTLAIGAGQMSRVDAVKVATMKVPEAGHLSGSVVASDAFFPFRDGLDAVAEAGATAVVQPGGSVRDAEVIAAADERGIALVFTGKRHFRH